MGQGEKAEAAGEEAEQVGRGQIKKDLFLDFSMKAWRAMGEGVLDLRVLFICFLFLSIVSALESRLEVGSFGSRKSSLKAIALIQVRNKAEPMNIATTGKI